MMGLRGGSLAIWCIMISATAFAQVRTSGIVVDSISFKSLPGVHVRINGKSGGTITDDQGHFSISAVPFDTLTFSAVGYVPVSFPVLLDEEDIMILMSEDVTYLLPVIVTAPFVRSPLIKDKPTVAARTPKASPLVSGSGIAFDYFSRAQRERRKLLRLIDANEKVRSYNTLVTDPEFKNEMVKRYVLTDEEYYNAILTFNLAHIAQVEYKTLEEVSSIMHVYFCKVSRHCQ